MRFPWPGPVFVFGFASGAMVVGAAWLIKVWL